jgi:SAM-dependent methyltransferase
MVENKLGGRPLEAFCEVVPSVYEGYGLEIGGTSGIFKSKAPLPIYALARRIDIVDYASNTIWSSRRPKYPIFGSDRPLVNFIISDATNLASIPDLTYDFVACSHVLEHIANPIKALFEWKRVLKKHGVLILVVPDKNCTFDHLRPVTSFEHIVNDFLCNIAEDDLTHLKEVLSLHDFDYDPCAIDRDQLQLRCKNNFKYRAMHHHVFNSDLLERALRYTGFEVFARDYCPPFHLVSIASKA